MVRDSLLCTRIPVFNRPSNPLSAALADKDRWVQNVLYERFNNCLLSAFSAAARRDVQVSGRESVRAAASLALWRARL